MTSVILKRCFIKKLLLFIGLISFLMILMPLPLAAQDEHEDRLEMEKEGTVDHDIWNIYGNNFEHIDGPELDVVRILMKNGHTMLQTDLTDVTENFKIELMFVLNVEDLDKLFKQLNEAGKMPSTYEESYKTKLALAKYIILPKFISLSNTIRIDASMYPIKEGATSISCYSIFKGGEVNSGIGKLAGNIAKKIFRNEGIDFTAEKKTNPLVGFRDFKNKLKEKEYDVYIGLIPDLINSSLADPKPFKFRLDKPNIDERDYDVPDTELVRQKGLDILISGYFFHVGDTMQISCDVMYSSGTMFTNKSAKIGKDENMLEKINELADKIRKEMNSRLN